MAAPKSDKEALGPQFPAKTVKSIMRTALSLESGVVRFTATFLLALISTVFELQFQVSTEATLLMSAAAELFIADVASTGWEHCCNKPRRAQRTPILSDTKLRASLSNREHFDFLVDLAPR